MRDGIEWLSASLSGLTGMRELGSCPLPSGLPDRLTYGGGVSDCSVALLACARTEQLSRNRIATQ